MEIRYCGFPVPQEIKGVETSAGPGRSQTMAIMCDRPSGTKQGTLSTRSTLSFELCPRETGAGVVTHHTHWVER